VLTGVIDAGAVKLPLRDEIHFGTAGCTLSTYGAERPTEIACMRVGQQFGSWIEVKEVLGSHCKAAGTVWSRVAGDNTTRRFAPRLHQVVVSIELIVEAGQRSCAQGIIYETRYYWVCREYWEAGRIPLTPHHRICEDGAHLLSFESVHAKPDGSDHDNPWYRRVFTQVRASWERERTP